MDLLTNAFLGDLRSERALDLRPAHAGGELGNQREAEARGEANAAQYAEGVIKEGGVGRKRRAHGAGAEIRETLDGV